MILSAYVNCAFIAANLLGGDAQHDVQFRERVSVCAQLTIEAVAQGVDPSLAIAVSWGETRLTRAEAPNPYDCVGPLQIKYRYWCPNENGAWSADRADGTLDGCDTLARGVFTLKYYTSRHKDVRRALCAYGWGRCDTSTRARHVDATLRTQRRVAKLLRQKRF